MQQLIAILLFLSATGSQAQTARVPKEKIPDSILDQIRIIEADFVLALQKDCGLNLCFPRGCVYVSHENVSMQGDQVLPGLPTEGKSLVSTDPQYILTTAACEYVHEDSLDKQTIQDLNRRLESKLSKGVLRVTARGIQIPESAAGKLESSKSVPLARLQKIENLLLEHFSWLLGCLLVAIMLMVGLWAWRRVGRDSKEDELRFLSYKRKLENEPVAGNKDQNYSEVQPEDAEARALSERITRLQDKHDQNPELLRARLHLWLDEGELSKVATSLLLLTGAEHSPLGPETQMSLHSLQLSEFMRTFAPGSKERQDTLQELEQEQALKTHFDQRTVMHVRRLFQDYDARDLLGSRAESGIEAKRALLALAPGIKIRELVDALNPNETLLLAESFCASNRIQSMELQRWFEWAAGSTPTASPARPGMNGASQECDASWILGFLMSKLPEDDRRDLTNQPPKPWTRTLFYPELLNYMSESRARDILLSVDATNLLHWYASLDSQQQRSIWGILPEAYRSQIRASGSVRVDMGRVMATIKTYGREAAKAVEEGD